MLEKIIIKGVATYNELGIEINHLKKINFIYGANGWGKTKSITKYLAEVTERIAGNFALTIKSDNEALFHENYSGLAR